MLNSYFDERYEIKEIIGEGGEGRIFLAYDRAVERPVAIKELKLQRKNREEALREARVIARISHPNVVSLYDIVEEDDTIYLIMEYVEGTSLREILQDLHMLDFQTALGIFIQVALAVEFAHNHGILHLDLKPENILVSKDGIVKLTDFGIARFVTEPEITNKIMGSTHYLAPEALKGKYSTATDVFALGVILYEMLAGQNPFFSYSQEEAYKKILEYDPPPVSRIRKDIPPEFDEILLKALAKHPVKRFKDVTRFRIKVERYFKYDYPEEPVKQIFETSQAERAKKIPSPPAYFPKISKRIIHSLSLSLLSFALILAVDSSMLAQSAISLLIVLAVSLISIPLGGLISFFTAAYFISPVNPLLSVLTAGLGFLTFFLLRDISKEASLAGIAVFSLLFGLENAALTLFFNRKKTSSSFGGSLLYLIGSATICGIIATLKPENFGFITRVPAGLHFLTLFLSLTIVPLISLLLSKALNLVTRNFFSFFSPAIAIFLTGILVFIFSQLGYISQQFIIERISISFALAFVLGISRLVKNSFASEI